VRISCPWTRRRFSEETLKQLQRFVDEAQRENGCFDAIVSTDGDSDRPLLAAITPEGEVKFYSGDLWESSLQTFSKPTLWWYPSVPMTRVNRWATANGAALHQTKLAHLTSLKPCTRPGRRVRNALLGWEANGGFMTATDIVEGGRTLARLPTPRCRAAFAAALYASKLRHTSLSDLFGQLPRRFSRAGLIDKFSPETSRGVNPPFLGSGGGYQRRGIQRLFRQFVSHRWQGRNRPGHLRFRVFGQTSGFGKVFSPLKMALAM